MYCVRIRVKTVPCLQSVTQPEKIDQSRIGGPKELRREASVVTPHPIGGCSRRLGFTYICASGKNGERTILALMAFG